tara:strand:- start:4891 stop:5598 length:708 start_codon:yes stop_codon:yes gene_type:complete
MGSSFGPNIVTDNLVVCLDAANAISYSGSGTTWKDVVGSRDTTLTNSPAFSTTNSGIFTLDGTDDYSTLGSDVELKDEGGWTMEHWVNPDTVDGNSNLFNFAGHASPTTVGWYFCIRGASSKLSIWNKDPGVWKDGSTTLVVGTWYQVVCVSENTSGTGYQFYVNGSAETGDHATYSFNGAGDYKKLLLQWIGRADSTNGRYFDGKFALSRFYTKALSASEVKQNYDANRGRFGL